ncbi:MAG: hypothetical protein LBH85_08960 [Treponema sp.]|jgi:hypothetical protein|nr:hypothetical protein [Treponema sp.]
MQILEIKNIVRKDVPIYYRMYYSGIAVMELINKSVERKIDFSIEIKPTGQKEILITIADPVDYPLIPIIRELKKHIDLLYANGNLPPL